MNTVTINSDVSMSEAFGVLRELFMRHKFLRLSIKTGKDRTIPQNSIGHAWYAQLARELREDDASGWKCYCKLHHGVPILRAEDEQFREFYDTAIKRLAYEQKLKAMEYVPVTSRMTTAQETAYLERVRDDFMARGVILKFPEAA